MADLNRLVAQLMRDQNPNPYESPKTESAQHARESLPYWTRQKVLYGGIALIFVALAAATGSHALFVESLAQNGTWDKMVTAIDIAAFAMFLTGLISLAVCQWFPDPRRKYLWRRRKNRFEMESQQKTRNE